ncbi:metallopeptidase family protein [Herbihabitans rhizosphaerae]|uniref:metallopeptidase family protein n=1 Tax=Herbihabitans rhizosphaerae TaxID=1872711 RepID=UPI00102C447B|nr:metallopeptidase family protein [Herbihabitans rhizosphaerae]
MTSSSAARRRARRDRRGRGLRGPLLPPSLPAASTRSERFDALVLEELEPIEERWGDRLAKLDVAVDEVPEVPHESDAQSGVFTDGGVPLARLVPAGMDSRGVPTSARIVLYRRPLEARAKDGTDLAELVREVLVRQIADYLGIDPETLD